jgi:DNA mismatch repair protein MutL
MVSESMPLAYRAELPFVYLGETFLAMPEKGGLTLLDHHAAHERVLYERLLKGLELQSRQLLFPRQVRLSHREYLAVLENRPLLLDFGMEVEDFGQDTVVVRSLPLEMEEADMRGILADAAEEMLAGQRPGRTIREAVAARMACHNSIRGRKVLSSEGLGALLEDLESTDDPGHCPHGRPTRLHYSLDALRKLFKRK